MLSPYLLILSLFLRLSSCVSASACLYVRGGQGERRGGEGEQERAKEHLGRSRKKYRGMKNVCLSACLSARAYVHVYSYVCTHIFVCLYLCRGEYALSPK